MSDRGVQISIHQIERQCGGGKTYLGTNAALEDTAGPARDGRLGNDRARITWCDLVRHGSLVGGCPGVRVVDLQGALEDVLDKGVVETGADSKAVGDTVALGDGDRSTRSDTVDLEEWWN